MPTPWPRNSEKRFCSRGRISRTRMCGRRWGNTSRGDEDRRRPSVRRGFPCRLERLPRGRPFEAYLAEASRLQRTTLKFTKGLAANPTGVSATTIIGPFAIPGAGMADTNSFIDTSFLPIPSATTGVAITPRRASNGQDGNDHAKGRNQTRQCKFGSIHDSPPVMIFVLLTASLGGSKTNPKRSLRLSVRFGWWPQPVSATPSNLVR